MLFGADEPEVVVAVRGFTKRSDDVGAVGKSGVVVDMLAIEEEVVDLTSRAMCLSI